MYEQIKQIGTAHYGSEAQGEAFAEGFLKQAQEMVKQAGPAAGSNSGAGNTTGFMADMLGLDRRLPNPSKGSTHTYGTMMKDKFLGGVAAEGGKGLVQGAFGLVGSAINAAANKLDSISLRSKYLKAVEQVIATNRIVNAEMKVNPEKVMSYADTIFKFAPHVACDPNLLASNLAGCVHGEGIDAMTIKTLTELENRVLQNSGM